MFKKADNIVAIIFIVISALLIYEARTFPKRASFAGGYVIFLALLLIIFSVLILISKDKKAESLEIKKFPKFLFLVLGTAFYIFLIPYIGFFTISFLYMIVVMKYFGVKGILPLIISPLVTLGFIYYIFVIFLTIPIPQGFLI